MEVLSSSLMEVTSFPECKFVLDPVSTKRCYIYKVGFFPVD